MALKIPEYRYICEDEWEKEFNPVMYDESTETWHLDACSMTYVE